MIFCGFLKNQHFWCNLIPRNGFCNSLPFQKCILSIQKLQRSINFSNSGLKPLLMVNFSSILDPHHGKSLDHILKPHFGACQKWGTKWARFGMSMVGWGKNFDFLQYSYPYLWISPTFVCVPSDFTNICLLREFESCPILVVASYSTQQVSSERHTAVHQTFTWNQTKSWHTCQSQTFTVHFEEQSWDYYGRKIEIFHPLPSCTDRSQNVPVVKEVRIPKNEA